MKFVTKKSNLKRVKARNVGRIKRSHQSMPLSLSFSLHLSLSSVLLSASGEAGVRPLSLFYVVVLSSLSLPSLLVCQTWPMTSTPS